MSKDGRPLSQGLSRTQMSTATSGGHHQNLLHRRHSKYENEYKRHIRLYDQEITSLKKTFNRLQVEKTYYEQEQSESRRLSCSKPELGTAKSPSTTPTTPLFENDEFVTTTVQQARGKIRGLRRQETKDRLALNNSLSGVPQELQDTGSANGTAKSSQQKTRRHSCISRLSSSTRADSPKILDRSASLESSHDNKLRKTWPHHEEVANSQTGLSRVSMSRMSTSSVERKHSDPNRPSIHTETTVDLAQVMKKRSRSFSVV